MVMTAEEWRGTAHKRVLLLGMSGLGKTRLSAILRAAGDWFHYSVDYRIGTRYMGEHIDANFKAEAMKNPVLAELWRSDSSRCRPIWASPAIRPGAACPSPNTCAARRCTPKPRWRR